MPSKTTQSKTTAKKVKAIPDGYHTVTPYLCVRNAAKAIEWYRKAFGAEETVRMNGPDGSVAHAEIRIGDSVVMLGDEAPMPGASKSPQTLGGTSGGLMIYVNDVDKAWKRAVDAGAKVIMPLSLQFWGDKYGKVQDPFGQDWSLGQHVEDVSPAEMEKRMKAAFSGPPPGQK
jgi:PhnB protein